MHIISKNIEKTGLKVVYTKEKFQMFNQNETQRRLFCFWTGNNEMSERRKRCFDTIKNSSVEVILITPKNLEEYIPKKDSQDFPTLHEGFQYLSETHKADYLRTYFMNFYGGGYSDIKDTRNSWIESFDTLNQRPDIWSIGYKEVGSWGVPNVPNQEINKVIHDNWFRLIGNGAYIFKKHTPFTEEWYATMMKVMDNKFALLKKYPSRYPQDL